MLGFAHDRRSSRPTASIDRIDARCVNVDPLAKHVENSKVVLLHPELRGKDEHVLDGRVGVGSTAKRMPMPLIARSSSAPSSRTSGAIYRLKLIAELLGKLSEYDADVAWPIDIAVLVGEPRE